MFSPHLTRARFVERLRLSAFSRNVERSFRERFVDGPFDETMLGKGVIQDIASLRELHENVQKTRPHPAGRRQLLIMSAIVIAPMLPVAFTAMPLEQALRRLAQGLMGL